MKASTGEHYVALDHVRGLAAFLVFSWHFTHSFQGTPISFRYVPALFFLAPLDEGHTGVALFMTLSGYLFAKLLSDKPIHYAAFFWNRILRLAPLLLVVFALVGVSRLRTGGSLADYGALLRDGLWLPYWPNGGWSIAVELHFYLALPLLMWLFRRSRSSLLAIVVAAIGFRAWYHAAFGDVRTLAYWSIVGRIDQFLLGMWASQFPRRLAGRHQLAAIVFLAFAVVYWWFDRSGGYVHTAGHAAWIWLPTVEGMAYALLIAWYDGSFACSSKGLSGFIAKMGEYSYSIYLLHFFLVFDLSRWIHLRIMPLSNFYVANFWALLAFVMMVPIGYLSFRFIESPFLKLRKRYVRPVAVENVGWGGAFAVSEREQLVPKVGQ